MDVVHDRASIIEEEEGDRISKLPDDIIHRILSFLDMKYAIQTSTLSKKWKHIWTSMPYLKLNSEMFHTLPQFARFVKHVLSHRNHHTEVSEVDLTFRGEATQFVVRSIIKYAYSHNARQLTMIRLTKQVLEFPQSLFRSHTLKHLTLASKVLYTSVRCVPNYAWDFPALETLNLSNMKLNDRGDKSLNLFSKCVNLKDLTLHHCSMYLLDVFNVCAPQLSNLTITDPCHFPKVFNVVAPQLESVTASVTDTNTHFLQLSVEDLDSLEEVNLSMRPPPYPLKKERYAPGLLDLFHKLCGAKILILDKGINEHLSACVDQLSDQPCPFNNLKCLKQKDPTPTMPTQVINYLLESSPTAIMDFPLAQQKRSREEVEKGTMDESSPSATSNMDLPQVPHKRSRQEADNGTMANTLEEEKQQTKTMDEEKRILEAKLFKQDEVIAEQKAMLEAMKVQHEKKMLEAKVHVQDEIIAQQKKAMLEATKLVHENGMLEEKMQMQDKLIAEQKAMLETMKLQNKKKMSEAKILRQDKIIAEQKAMLEAMKLQQEKIETELGNIDS